MLKKKTQFFLDVEGTQISSCLSKAELPSSSSYPSWARNFGFLVTFANYSLFPAKYSFSQLI